METPADINPALGDAFALGLFVNPNEAAEKPIIISDIVVDLGDQKGSARFKNGGNHTICCPLFELGP